MAKAIELARIGGEAKYFVLEENGVAREAYFVSTAPIRGFEKLVMGKNPFFVVEAVMRICGICHAAHGIASCEAFEDAIGVAPPPNGRFLRETIGLVNRVQSHITHLILMLPDIVHKEAVQGLIVEAVKLLNRVDGLMAKLGGTPTHPRNIVIGGVARIPPEKTLAEAISEAEALLRDYEAFRRRIMDNLDKEAVERLRRHRVEGLRLLATHLYYGDRYVIDFSRIRLLRYEEYRGRDLPFNPSMNTTLIALYGGNTVEVGPRARLAIYRGYNDQSLWGLQEARFEEIVMSLRRTRSLLEQIDPREPPRVPVVGFRRGRGIGVYEAPRGVLIHMVELSGEGRVMNYKIIVPTMFNIPWMEAAGRGFPVQHIDVVPRIYDPCIPCTTHVINVGGPR